MRKIFGLSVTAYALAVPFSAALAAGGREDDSSLVVWIFFGFCALILIAQLLPAIRGARKTAREERERKAMVRPVRVQLDK